MEGLGRINLCVGTNNCGKTSILEAIDILAANGRTEALWNALARRGEQWIDNATRVIGRAEVDICHLFHGHEITENAVFKVLATDDTRQHKLNAHIIERAVPDLSPEEAYQLEKAERDSSKQSSLFDANGSETGLPGDLALDLIWNGSSSVSQRLPITLRGGIAKNTFRNAWVRDAWVRDDVAKPTNFITTEALTRDVIIGLFEEIVLTPEESSVIEALSTIEPTLERIAPISSNGRLLASSGRGGLVVKLKNSSQRIPIGSMGDGIWRMLGIALSLVSARGGILLVDEIDTGLHYSVMADMWRMVRDTAERLDVQVFATTHSRDCVESLAAISRSDVTNNSEVSIQRIERNSSQAISFTERDIVIAAKRAIEIR